MALPNSVIQMQPVIQDSISGNGSDVALSSIMELQIQQILSNNRRMLAFRMLITANQIINASGIGVGVYRLPDKILWGNAYNSTTGIPLQTGSVQTAQVFINRKLTFGFTVEEFDMNQFNTSGNFNLRVGLMSKWLASGAIGYLHNLEAYLIRGVNDYATAYTISGGATTETSSSDTILYIGDLVADTNDTTALSTEEIREKGEQIARRIKQKIIALSKKFTRNTFGVKQEEMQVEISEQLAFIMQSMYATSYDRKGTATQVRMQEGIPNGRIYGVDYFENFMLKNSFIKPTTPVGGDTGSAISRDEDFDFLSLDGIVTHKNVVAMPNNWREIVQWKTNDNKFNPVWAGKADTALPTFLRDGLTFLIKTVSTTQAQITTAIANRDIGTNTETATYNVANYFSDPIPTF